MAKNDDVEGYEVGNTDRSKRGHGKRPERESGGGRESDSQAKGQRGEGPTTRRVRKGPDKK